MSTPNVDSELFSSCSYFYERLFADAPIGIATVSSDGRITSANPFLCQLLGYSPDELLQLSVRDITHPDDIQNEVERIREMIKQQLPRIAFEKRYRKKSGEYVWTELVTSSVYSPDGKLLFGLGMIVEITKRKKAEAALQASEERYRSIYANSPIAIEYYDMAGKLIDVNAACLDLFGVKNKEQVLGFNLFTDPNLPDKFKKKLKQGLVAKYRTVFDFDKVRKYRLFETEKAGIIYLDVIIKPVGKPLDGYLVQIQDITGETLARKKLLESEARWQFALEGAGDGVWDWDARTDLVFFSSRWKSMLGFSDDEVGDTLAEWESRVHPEDKEAAYADLARHFSGETPVYQNEHRLLCKDGSYKWILDRGKVIERSETGEPLRIIGTHSDITDRKGYEAEREAMITELNAALATVKKLSGLLPICSYCKKIRDDKGYWNQIERFIQENSDAEFTHSICQDCLKKYFPDYDISIEMK